MEVCFRFEEGEEIEVGPINLPSEITERQRNILDLILHDEPINERLNERLNLSQTEMAKRLGLSVSTLRREIKVLENSGIVHYVGSKKVGYWVLAQETEETGKETENSKILSLVNVIGNQTLTVKEIMSYMELKGGDNFRKNYLYPAIEDGYIAMLYPEMPSHRKQAYYLTEKGLSVCFGKE